MMRSTLFGLAAMAGLALSSAALAAPPQKAERLALAAKGAEICAQAMPDERAADQMLKASGFKFIDANGPMRAYTAGQNHVVVVITTGATKATGCLVSASRMTEAEALQLIQPWLQVSGARPVRPRPDLEHVWAGSFKGGPVEMGVEKSADLMYFRGAAIMARAAQ